MSNINYLHRQTELLRKLAALLIAARLLEIAARVRLSFQEFSHRSHRAEPQHVPLTHRAIRFSDGPDGVLPSGVDDLHLQRMNPLSRGSRPHSARRHSQIVFGTFQIEPGEFETLENRGAKPRQRSLHLRQTNTRGTRKFGRPDIQ